jgi:hypothetical protein
MHCTAFGIFSVASLGSFADNNDDIFSFGSIHRSTATMKMEGTQKILLLLHTPFFGVAGWRYDSASAQKSSTADV